MATLCLTAKAQPPGSPESAELGERRERGVGETAGMGLAEWCEVKVPSARDELYSATVETYPPPPAWGEIIIFTFLKAFANSFKKWMIRGTQPSREVALVGVGASERENREE